MKSIVSARLMVPFWCSFRMPYTINVNYTYPVPPPVTLYGLISCALGLPADCYDLLDEMKITVGVEEEGEVMETYSRIIKRDHRTPDRRTLVIRQKLLQPVFRLYVLADKEFAGRIAGKLNDPVFPLYLGESDDILEVDEVEVFQYKEELTEIVDSILPAEAGIRPTSMYTTAFLPIAFKRGKRDWAGVDYRSYYVGPQLTLEQPIRAVAAGEKRVVF